MQASEDQIELTAAIHLAAENRVACAAVRDIYTRLQIEIDRRKPRCVASGKCCHFEAYGHRLYVTTLELATFRLDAAAAQLDLRPNIKPSGLPIVTQSCPLQTGKLCGVHAIRPFGCRIFFCDPTAADWQQQQYELFHQELKQLHELFEVPYFYVEWRQALLASVD